MPNRVIRETVTTSQTLDLLSGDGERMWHRLTTVADDFGRFEADPRVLLAKCFPLRVDTLKSCTVAKWFDELLQTDAVISYEVDGKRFGAFVNWGRHQRKRANNSKYPPPPDGAADIRCHLTADDSGCQQMSADDSTCCQMSSETRDTRHETRDTRHEREDSGADAPTAVAGPSPSDVQSFHGQVLTILGKADHQLRLTDKRKAKVRRRWRELEKVTTDPVTGLLGAVLAFSRSEWHSVNGYTDPYEYVMRSPEKVDEWLEKARKAGITAGDVKGALECK